MRSIRLGYSKADMMKLYTAVIADILDSLGVRNSLVDPEIRPLSPDAVVFGPALTVQAVEVCEVKEEPYEKEIGAVDSLQEGQVLVASVRCSRPVGFWGELLSTGAVARGASGVIIDGMTRDAQRIIEMKFPVFARGISGYDSKGRSEVIGYGMPIVCGGVEVNPGDFIFGDYDGVAVIPAKYTAQVIEQALEKVRGENSVRSELIKGKSVKEVYERFKIL
jgi:regulator of RNase E activity RraA